MRCYGNRASQLPTLGSRPSLCASLVSLLVCTWAGRSGCKWVILVPEMGLSNFLLQSHGDGAFVYCAFLLLIHSTKILLRAPFQLICDVFVVVSQPLALCSNGKDI